MKDRFPDSEAIADASPLLASISFSVEEADVLQTQLIQKKERTEKASVRSKRSKVSERPKQKPSELHEDLEKEAED